MGALISITKDVNNSLFLLSFLVFILSFTLFSTITWSTTGELFGSENQQQLGTDLYRNSRNFILLSLAWMTFYPAVIVSGILSVILFIPLVLFYFTSSVKR